MTRDTMQKTRFIVDSIKENEESWMFGSDFVSFEKDVEIER